MSRPNVINFPDSPLTKEQSREKLAEWEKGAILVIGDDGTDISIFGNPTAMELLWLSEVLRQKAMFEDEE
jgi:hypothetical protein